MFILHKKLKQVENYMKYAIKKVLARNDAADILIADFHNNNNVTPVIIKSVLPDIQGDLKVRIDTARRLSHPCIQELVEYGHFQKDGIKKAYLASRYNPGVTLTQLLERLALQKLSVPYAFIIHIINSLCEAMGYTHEMSSRDGKNDFVPHGNICPDNIFITFDGNVFLVDTGIADIVKYRYNGNGIVTNDITLFAHPDILQGADWNRKYELYSLGVLLLCMSIGNDSFNEIFNIPDSQKILNAPKKYFPVPGRLEHVILRSTGNKLFGTNSKFTTVKEFCAQVLDFAKSKKIDYGKKTTGMLVYALFCDSEEIPSYLHNFFNVFIDDYVAHGDDTAICQILKHNSIEMHKFNQPQEKKTFVNPFSERKPSISDTTKIFAKDQNIIVADVRTVPVIPPVIIQPSRAFMQPVVVKKRVLAKVPPKPAKSIPVKNTSVQPIHTQVQLPKTTVVNELIRKNNSHLKDMKIPRHTVNEPVTVKKQIEPNSLTTFTPQGVTPVKAFSNIILNPFKTGQNNSADYKGHPFEKLLIKGELPK
jgi:serine/threonine protein kinase